MAGVKKARVYVRKHLNALNLKEHRQLDFDNVDSTQLADHYHIESEDISGLPKTQGSQPLEADLVIRFWTKPRSKEDPVDVLERNHDVFDVIMQRLMDERNMEASNISGVVLDTYLPTATSETNNQIIKGELSLTIKFDICYRDPSLV